MTHEIALIPGDGIGQEVVPAAIEVLSAVGPGFEFVELSAGDHVRDERGNPLPAETVEAVSTADATARTSPGSSASPEPASRSAATRSTRTRSSPRGS